MPYGVYEKNGEIYILYDEKLLGIYDGEKDAEEFMKKYMSEKPKLKYILMKVV